MRKLVLLALLLVAGPAHATTTITFSPGSLIIPMDGCYQRPSFVGDADLKTIFSLTNAQLNARECNSTSEKDDGLIKAYGLVSRLIAAGIPVYWAIAPGKTSLHGVDFTVTRAGGSPVLYFNTTTGTTTTRYSTLTTISYAGAPWIIAASDAQRAKDLIATLGAQLSEVNIHVSQASFTAPIHRRITELPKLAILDMSGDWTQDKTNFILEYPLNALFTAQGTWWDVVSADDLIGGRLQRDGFTVLWVPPAEIASYPPTVRQTQIVDAIGRYLDNGGYVVVVDSMIATLEGYGSTDATFSTYSQEQPQVRGFMTQGGIIYNGIRSGWGINAEDEAAVTDDPADPLSQYGGIPWTGVGGGKTNWKPRPGAGGGYLAGVQQAVYSDKITDPNNLTDKDDRWAFAAWRHKDNDASKGKLFYLGGFHWRYVAASGFRIMLNSLFADAVALNISDTREVTRASPIVATVAGQTMQLLGTFEAENPLPAPQRFLGGASADEFRFPAVVGHMRGVALASISPTPVELADVGGVLFDAATAIPPVNAAGCASPFTAACRSVFTAPASGTAPLFLTTAAAEVLKPIMAPDLTTAEVETLIARVLAGQKSGAAWVPKLGGVDRSTVAVIGASPVLRTPRPTIAYFGATDGMLHAVCVEVLAPCTALGQELWAFLPREQLAAVRNNTQRVDGSPHVADVFGDFGSGTPSWRTLLVFQTGSGRMSQADAPSIHALDVTNPANPKVLWTRAAASNRGAHEQGIGLGVAMGPVRSADGGVRHLTFAQTNNGGTGGAGVWLAALDTITGETVWTWSYEYPAPRVPSNAPVPSTGIPGGVSVVDSKGNGTIDRVIVPTLYGDLWVLDALAGSNVNGNTALFSFSTDFHPLGAPVTVYRQGGAGGLRVLMVSGGYADPNVSDWSPANVHQYAVSVTLSPPAGAAPLSELSSGTHRQFTIDLGAGQRAYAQAVIAGDVLHLTTDSSDVNDTGYGFGGATGRLSRYQVSTGQQLGSLTSIGGGASSVDVHAGNVYVASAATTQSLPPDSEGDTTNGSAAELVFDARTGRRVWLRLR